MKIDQAQIHDLLVYEIMYFSPIQVGEERNSNLLYFTTELYHRVWPQAKAEQISSQIDQLRHVELGIAPFDQVFKGRHREAVLLHCKMALAYLDARDARISMKLCEICEPATKSTERSITMDPQADFDFLRIVTLSVMACAARRVKFYKKAVDALSEAKDICLMEGDQNRVHPLMTALTLLSLSAVLADLDHDEHALRWGLESLAMMYSIFHSMDLPERVQAYYIALACHNAALINVKLEKWGDAVELVNEGIEFTKVIGEADDSLRKKLISIGAQAKHVPEGFLQEAVNALNGWGEDCGVWNLSFWDFSVNEILEEIHVLKNTTTLKHIIIEHIEDVERLPKIVDDENLAKFILAVVSCQCLEKFSISNIDFDPRRVWRRIKKRSFSETSWYAATLIFPDAEKQVRPELADVKGVLKQLNFFSKKLTFFLVVIGNECDGVDFSENAINEHSISALVHAIRWPDRPDFTRPVSTLVLRQNDLGEAAAEELAKMWADYSGMFTLMDLLGDDLPESPNSGGSPLISPKTRLKPSVTSLDVSDNKAIGDRGFDKLTDGLAQFSEFKVLKAGHIGLSTLGCKAVEKLQANQLEHLCLSNNKINSEGAEVVIRAAMQCAHLHTLEMDDCGICGTVASTLAELLRTHETLRNISLDDNKLGSEGAVEFCSGAAASKSLETVKIGNNDIYSEDAASSIGEMMRECESLRELTLSGNKMKKIGAHAIGSAIEHSRVLKMYLEDMGFSESSIDDFLDHGAAETQDLQVMVLDRNPVGDEGLGIIAECLSIGLTELSLSQCELTDKSQATILNLVSLSPNLRSLCLSYNNLGATGCADMVQWMTQNEKDNFSLRSLELAYCELGDQGFYAMVPVLGALSYLGVRGNKVTSAGLEAVMNANMMIQLQCLDLSDNQIGEPGVHALTERFQQEHKRSLWNPKQLTSTIDTVILKNNPLIEPCLAASTEIFLKIHNPLLSVIW